MDDRPPPRPRAILSLLAWLLPQSGVKTWVLRRLGNDISSSAVIGSTLVLGCGRFRIGDDTVIDPFNLFKGLSRAEIGAGVRLGRYNQFTAVAGYQEYSTAVGALFMHDRSLITNRHYIDCSGQVIIGRGAAVGGLRTTILTHEFDLASDSSSLGKVTVRDFAMTGTCCILLKDAVVPPFSVLAAGTVMPKSNAEAPERGLYGGVPAKFIRELPTLDFWKSGGGGIKPVVPFDDAAFRADGS